MVLNRAGKYHIKVPHSRLINNREDLETFFRENNGRVVTKPVHGAVFYLKDDYAYLSFTNRMRQQEIDLLPDTFFTSLYQEFIESDFEDRKSVVSGKSESVRVDLGGSSLIKQKKCRENRKHNK